MGRFFWTGIVLSLLGIATCVDPTEMHVTIYTDICEKLDVAISTEDKPPSAQKVYPRPPSCNGRRRLGDIVFVPSSSGRRFTFRVRAAAEGGDCATGTRCVSASRNVAYLDRTSLELEIDLTSDCIDVKCGSTQTCDHGQCIDAFVDCKTKTCDDGGVREASVVDVIIPVMEAGVCLPPKVVLNNGGSPTFYWPFTNTGNAIKEQMSGKTTQLLNGTMTSNKAAFGCGESLATAGIQPLGVMHQSNGFGASMYAFVPSSGPSTNFLLTKSSGGNQGVKIFVDFKHDLWIQTCGVSCSDTIFPAFPLDRWVAFEVQATSMGSILVDFDGMKQIPTTANVNPMAFSPGALQMGDGQAWIDELRVYDVP